MRKATLNFIVDAIAFVAFVFLAATGVLVRYVLPPGSGHFATLWSMDRHDWGELHFWIAVALLAALALHLLLHWRWIVNMIKGKPREKGGGVRLGLAAIALFALAGLAAAPFFVTVEQTDTAAPHKQRRHEAANDQAHEISGSMTLEQVEQVTGVPADVIIQALGLPPDTPRDQRLGRLRRTHGFEMQDIRNIISAHAARRADQP